MWVRQQQQQDHVRLRYLGLQLVISTMICRIRAPAGSRIQGLLGARYRFPRWPVPLNSRK